MSSKQKDTKINLQIELMKEVEENFKFFAKEVDQVDIKEKSQNITIKNMYVTALHQIKTFTHL